jgi:hypothetical protein
LAKRRVDIAAGQDDPDLVPGKDLAIGDHGKARCACAFDDGLLDLQQQGDRPFEMGFIDKHDVVDEIGKHRRGELPRLLHRDPFGKGIPAAWQFHVLELVEHRRNSCA